jgi:DNA-3-methyladenine glycosylase II
LGPQGLRAVGLSRAKSHSLVALAERQTAQHFGALDWSKLPLEEAVERLDAEPGVGRWTAENALLRGIGRPDVFIAGDLGIRYALQHYGAVRRSATEERIRRWAEARYPEWGSYATLYLWRRWIDESRAAAGG